MATKLFLVLVAVCLAFSLQVAGNVAETVCRYDSANPTLCTQPPADNILYMGDTTMNQLFKQSKTTFRGPALCKEQIPPVQCNLAKYLGFTQVNDSDWVRPGPTVGPACNVAATCYPGCSECSSCTPAKYVCPHNRSMEYIPIEFARDVEVQSTNARLSSTQEHVGRYLMEHQKDLCVVSTGLHDAALRDQERMFSRNVLVYLELIRPGCKRVVWITTTAIRGDLIDLAQPRNNTLLRRRDLELIALLKLLPVSGLSIIDVFEASLEWEHETQAWYQLLGNNLIGRTLSATKQAHQHPLPAPAASLYSQPPLLSGRISGVYGAGYKKSAYLVAIKKSIAGLCDWTIITSMDHGTEIIKQRSPPRTIYISFVSIQRDFHRPENPIVTLASLLETGAITSPVVLLSGSTDMTFPHQTDKRMRGNYNPTFLSLVASIASSPLVERWNVENLVGPYHSKMVPMPLGFLTVGCDGAKEVQYPCDKNMWRNINGHTPLASRTLTMMCTGRGHPGSNGQFDLRNNAIANCKEGGPWSAFVQQASNKKLGHKEFVDSQRNVSFMLCPHGGGIDPAPKAFEALASGTIPIVQRSDLYDAYKVFPIAWVDDFSPESITVAKLKAWRDELAPRFDDPEEAKKLAEQMTMRYWWHYAVDGTSAAADPIYPSWPGGAAGASTWRRHRPSPQSGTDAAGVTGAADAADAATEGTATVTPSHYLPGNESIFTSAADETFRVLTHSLADKQYLTKWRGYNAYGGGGCKVSYMRATVEITTRGKLGDCTPSLDVLAWLMDQLHAKTDALMLNYGGLIHIHREHDLVDKETGKWFDDDIDLWASLETVVHVGQLEPELFRKFGWTLRVFANQEGYIVLMQIMESCGHTVKRSASKILDAAEPALELYPIAVNSEGEAQDLWQNTRMPESMIFPPKRITVSAKFQHLQEPREPVKILACIYGDWTVKSTKHSGLNRRCKQ